MDILKEVLIGKFEEIERRILLVLAQLNNEQVNWRPNESSNSIANLIVHMRGNIRERIGKGILNEEYTRERDQEFTQLNKNQSELKETTTATVSEIIQTIKDMSEETLKKTQLVRNRERTNLEILVQCATHYSEHMGQILYIGKMLLDDKYTTTSMPRNIN
jgi:uncharacterized damage-inducible protein DinB